MRSEIIESRHWIIKINKKWTKVSLSSVIGVILFALFSGTHCGYPDRARVAEVLVHLSQYRVEVANLIEANKEIKIDATPQLGTIGSLTTRDDIPIEFEHIEINREGTIWAITSGLPTFIKLTPIIDNGRVVEWKCSGKPQKIFPSVCK